MKIVFLFLLQSRCDCCVGGKFFNVVTFEKIFFEGKIEKLVYVIVVLQRKLDKNLKLLELYRRRISWRSQKAWVETCIEIEKIGEINLP